MYCFYSAFRFFFFFFIFVVLPTYSLAFFFTIRWNDWETVLIFECLPFHLVQNDDGIAEEKFTATTIMKKKATAIIVLSMFQASKSIFLFYWCRQNREVTDINCWRFFRVCVCYLENSTGKCILMKRRTSIRSHCNSNGSSSISISICTAHTIWFKNSNNKEETVW